MQTTIITGVAMSGGVDSSAAAVLLLKQGYSVFGITMIHYESKCRRAAQAAEDARRVCQTLGIEHRLYSLQSDFQHRVIHEFIREYLAGRTPNPCVTCNRTIKWGLLQQKALEQGAEYMATGHYVRLFRNSRYQLIRSENRDKDQSYALWRLTQDQLARSMFPLEGLSKSNVREIAHNSGLDIAHKSESQDVCFIPDDDYKRFLIETLKKEGVKIEPGEIVDMQGNVLGEHKGIPFYTIGQRKGLGIALGKPAYVVEIDADHNRIRIGDRSDLLANGLHADNANWVSVSRPDPGTPVTAHIRYNDPGAAAMITHVNDDSFTLRFEHARPSVTPGQSAVLYQGDRLIGGGIIDSALKDQVY
ncbi:MAG: tRNA 2-thiouridine(34) synthase MnmA [candidate division KSB1 bacterium]|nr:tRNA 2-thiouridine(34) synthase MnmA [candidate division KSB1 bacterium]